ncbi:hypothetical protein NEOKW01_0019 [Nematocida sp. AWRm80]|nr:hypothetical protein NEOKW01_0019 [Nematocida sp. AWRm80]
MIDDTKEKLINSEKIKESINHILGLHRPIPIPFEEIFLQIKNDIEKHFRKCLNTQNLTIKDEEFQKEIIAYKSGIITAIDITKETGENASDSILNKFMAKPQDYNTQEDKDSLADILEKEISKQLSDIILGLSDIKEKLKNNKEAMKRFENLEIAYNKSNSLVKNAILNDLQLALTDVNKKSIQGLNYKSIKKIKELSLQEVLNNWDIILTSSKTIVDDMNDIINALLYDENITTDPKKQDGLKYTLRFFKTVANHLPELIGQKSNLPNLSAVHSKKRPFFKKFTRSALKDKSSEQLAEEINKLYETASKPSLLDRFKSLSPQIRLLIVLLVIVAVVIAASLLLFYLLSHKDTVQQVVV